MIELELCPCCGGEAEGLSILPGRYFFVRCKRCLLSTKDYSTKEEAANAWNKRTKDMTSGQEQLTATWTLHRDGSGTCNHCHRTQKGVWDYDNHQNYCGCCGAKMNTEVKTGVDM